MPQDSASRAAFRKMAATVVLAAIAAVTITAFQPDVAPAAATDERVLLTLPSRQG